MSADHAASRLLALQKGILVQAGSVTGDAGDHPLPRMAGDPAAHAELKPDDPAASAGNPNCATWFRIG